MLNPELSTNPRNIASSQVSHHTPIIGVGNCIHTKNLLYTVQCIQAIAPAADSDYTLRSTIRSTKRPGNLAQCRFALVGDLTVGFAIIADTMIIKGDKGHGFRKNAFCAPAKCVLPCRIMRVFTRNNLDSLNSFDVKRSPAASDLLRCPIGVVLWKNPF